MTQECETTSMKERGICADCGEAPGSLCPKCEARLKKTGIWTPRDEMIHQRAYFSGLTHEALVDVTLTLLADTARLRKELDKAKGVIR